MNTEAPKGSSSSMESNNMEDIVQEQQQNNQNLNVSTEEITQEVESEVHNPLFDAFSGAFNAAKNGTFKIASAEKFKQTFEDYPEISAETVELIHEQEEFDTILEKNQVHEKLQQLYDLIKKARQPNSKSNVGNDEVNQQGEHNMEEEEVQPSSFSKFVNYNDDATPLQGYFMDFDQSPQDILFTEKHKSKMYELEKLKQDLALIEDENKELRKRFKVKEFEMKESLTTLNLLTSNIDKMSKITDSV